MQALPGQVTAQPTGVEQVSRSGALVVHGGGPCIILWEAATGTRSRHGEARSRGQPAPAMLQATPGPRPQIPIPSSPGH